MAENILYTKQAREQKQLSVFLKEAVRLYYMILYLWTTLSKGPQSANIISRCLSANIVLVLLQRLFTQEASMGFLTSSSGLLQQRRVPSFCSTSDIIRKTWNTPTVTCLWLLCVSSTRCWPSSSSWPSSSQTSPSTSTSSWLAWSSSPWKLSRRRSVLCSLTPFVRSLSATLASWLYVVVFRCAKCAAHHQRAVELDCAFHECCAGPCLYCPKWTLVIKRKVPAQTTEGGDHN